MYMYFPWYTFLPCYLSLFAAPLYRLNAAMEIKHMPSGVSTCSKCYIYLSPHHAAAVWVHSTSFKGRRASGALRSFARDSQCHVWDLRGVACEARVVGWHGGLPDAGLRLSPRPNPHLVPMASLRHESKGYTGMFLPCRTSNPASSTDEGFSTITA